MINRYTKGIDIENSSHILDAQEELARQTYMNLLRLKKRDYKTITPTKLKTDPPPHQSSSPSSPPMGKLP